MKTPPMTTVPINTPKKSTIGCIRFTFAECSGIDGSVEATVERCPQTHGEDLRCEFYAREQNVARGCFGQRLPQANLLPHVLGLRHRER